jgi:hypothetical protein
VNLAQFRPLPLPLRHFRHHHAVIAAHAVDDTDPTRPLICEASGIEVAPAGGCRRWIRSGPFFLYLGMRKRGLRIPCDAGMCGCVNPRVSTFVRPTDLTMCSVGEEQVERSAKRQRISLLVAYPELEEEWSPSNGPMASFSRASHRIAQWVCPKGHQSVRSSSFLEDTQENCMSCVRY